ncbi:MAG: dockerin type I repeat-containing protein [Christensenellaceae bacterium]|nr:dockerin type I repeat-containing protein [Christensenellaceae bacterium]
MKKLLSMLLAVFLLFAVVPNFNLAESPATEVATTDDNVPLFGFSLLKYRSGAVATHTREFIGFNSEMPGSTQTIGGISGRISYGADVVDGFVYAYAHTFHDEDFTCDRLYRINPTTWQSTAIGSELDINYQIMDMTYAADRSTMYAMVLTTDDSHYHLMTVNLTNGQLTEVTDMTEQGIIITNAFAYIGNGNFFGIAKNVGRSVIFNENGIIRELGVTVNASWENLSGATYYQPNGCVYGFIARSIPAGNFGLLIKIDPETGVAEEVGSVGGGYGHELTNLFILPDYELDVSGGVDQEEFDAAINAPGSSLTFINDTTTPWAVVTEGQRTFARSSIQGQHGASTSITAVFNGLSAGQVLTFDWFVSSENSYDWLTFAANGNTVQRISGPNGSWATYTYQIPSAGDYTFTWTYSKDSSASSGSDIGCIDNVSLSGNQPEPYDPSQMYQAFSNALNVSGGNLTFYNDISHAWAIETDNTGRTYVGSTVDYDSAFQTFYIVVPDAHAGDAIRFDYKTDTELWNRLLFIQDNAIQAQFSGDNDWQQYTYIIPHDGTFFFSWKYVKTDDSYWKGSENGGLKTQERVWVDNVEYIHDYSYNPPVNPNMPDAAAFNNAANLPGETRSFVNDNEHPWQIANIDNRTCVVSDIAGIDGVITTFTVDIGYVTAGTVISFDWKTSTEEGWDCARLTLNDYTYVVSSGVNDWTSVSLTIENSGEYVIGWQYEKDADGRYGQDCVWVDNIRIGAPILEGDAGDVDGDGEITVGDAIMILRHAMSVGSLSDEAIAVADMDGDGEITIADALIVMRIAMGIA